MEKLNLKPTHSVVKSYYRSLSEFEQLHLNHEFAVRSAFQYLLDSCGRQYGWKIVPEWRVRRGKHSHIQVDGALVDTHRLVRGFWEAKDSNDNLEKDIATKLQLGYPDDNIIFQSPDRAVLFQNSSKVLSADLRDPSQLVSIVCQFFEYLPPAYEDWEIAVKEFKYRVPELAATVLDKIRQEQQSNAEFTQAFEEFLRLCRESLNPNISRNAVEEMLIQHLLTERILRRVFNNPDFTQRNTIAREIEKVIRSLTKRSFNRDEFLKQLDRFYHAIEVAAATIGDFYHKQQFLNSVYEEFFQGFSVKAADTHGIIYTPEVIVNFMISTVKEILTNEFGKSISDRNIHIIDPFVGTGNFIVHIMQEIERFSLPSKYESEIHCNEVMLLPYYIASLNIEHEFYDLMDRYEPFSGICLVDTFDLYEHGQQSLTFNRENTSRIVKQRQAPIFVVIGNPPYNAWQVNENDNNKNRKYEDLDRAVAKTYMKDSNATNKSALCDPYVKAFRWASDRIGAEGMVAFVSNNSFLENYAFDGMRKHLVREFSSIYHINLKGDARTSGEARRREGGNIFDDQIRVGVGITFLVRKKEAGKGQASVYVYSIPDYFRSGDKARFLRNSGNYKTVPFTKCDCDESGSWLTEGLRPEFAGFISLGRPKKGTDDVLSIFRIYSNGVKTNRDAWMYGESTQSLRKKVELTIRTFNEHVRRWRLESARGREIEDIFDYDDRRISWSRDLKKEVGRLREIEFRSSNVRPAMYRPFCRRVLYFDPILNEEVYSLKSVFPTGRENENVVICCSAVANNKPFHCLAVNVTPDIHLTGDSQCFPFYTYRDGGKREENISDAILYKFQAHYQDTHITKWDIFHFVYAVLHHPLYRERYEANLRRELPRIPFAPGFNDFAAAGEKLKNLHINFDGQGQFPLERIERKAARFDLDVERMRFSAGRRAIIYNKFLSLDGIPGNVFSYKLGTTSALEWVMEQFRFSQDKRSEITRDPNERQTPGYLIELLAKVITVSLETNAIVGSLPDIGIKEEKKAAAAVSVTEAVARHKKGS